jgi:outer membrane immunogenic protein
MKRFFLSAVALSALAVPAFAADMPPRTYTKAPALTPPQVGYNWTGFYIGGHLGGAFAGSNSKATTPASLAACRAGSTTSSPRTG